MEKVEQMQAMEKNLVGMAREAEKLRAEVLNAEKRVHAPSPYGGGHYMHPDPLYPPQMPGAGAYVESYGRPMGLGMMAYGGGNKAAASGGSSSLPTPPAAGAPIWGGAYNSPLPRR